MNNISLQLMVLVFMAFTLFAVGSSTLIGVQSYNDLEAIATERVEGAAQLYASEYEAQMNRTFNSLRELENNHNLMTQLSRLTHHGPLYQSHSQHSPTISDQQQVAYMHSQLQLARTLIYLLPLHDLSHLAIYQQDAFSQFSSAPLPSLLIDHEYIWFYRYSQRGGQAFQMYRLALDQLSYDESLFSKPDLDPASIQSHFQSLGLETVQQPPFDFYRHLIRPASFVSGQAMNVAQDKLNVAIWFPLTLDLLHPNTEQSVQQDGALIMAIHTPNQTALANMANRIGTHLAIVDDEHVWVSSINTDQPQPDDDPDRYLEDRPYVFSEVVSGITSDNGQLFRIMALSSTEGLKTRTQNLILRMSLVTLLVVSLTTVALYWLINLKLKTPLDSLMRGVREIHNGNFNHQVEIQTNNELSILSDSFNLMTQHIRQRNHDLQTANDTLEQKVQLRTQELNNAQQQLILSEKMAALGQLVAGVAHEINTPLGNSITALSFNHDAHRAIEKQFENKTLKISDFGRYLEETKESITLMEHNLRKASELVQSFKNVAVNQSVEELVEFSMEKHIHEVLITLRPKLKTSQVKMQLEIEQNMVITSYPGAYYHIISNMIMNSLTHAFPEQQGIIIINAHTEGDRIKLSFKDDGVGMDEATTARIFDPFYTTKRGKGGTGLGLYMTFNFVTQRLEGNIQVHSQPGRGTEFALDLPLHLSEADGKDHSDHFSIQ